MSPASGCRPVTTSTGSWSGQRTSFPAATRRRVLDRDQHTCQLSGPDCTGTATEADHVVPVAEGGTDDEGNGQAACATCHAVKTRQEIARGQARMPKRTRPPSPHPGLVGGAL